MMSDANPNDSTELARPEILEDLIYLGVQGERLRVANRVLAGLPVSERDAQILACGVATAGEHIEAGRRTVLRLVRKIFGENAQAVYVEKVMRRAMNEGGDKP